jgi:hypothetical protein
MGGGPSCRRGGRSKSSKFNARAETVSEKPFYRQTFKRNRCFDPDFRLLRVAGHAGRQTTLVLYATRG